MRVCATAAVWNRVYATCSANSPTTTSRHNEPAVTVRAILWDDFGIWSAVTRSCGNNYLLRWNRKGTSTVLQQWCYWRPIKQRNSYLHLQHCGKVETMDHYSFRCTWMTMSSYRRFQWFTHVEGNASVHVVSKRLPEWTNVSQHRQLSFLFHHTSPSLLYRFPCHLFGHL